MTPDLSPEEWIQVRYEYEHTDKPVDDICLDHRVSPSTLRERMRRWRWTRRRQPISAEGPPPTPWVEPAAPLVPAIAPIRAPAPSVWFEPQDEPAPDSPAPHATLSDEPPPVQSEVVPRLQGAVARVMPAIEANRRAACGRADAAARSRARGPHAHGADADLARIERFVERASGKRSPRLHVRRAGRYRRVPHRACTADRGFRGFENRRKP